MTLKQMKLFLKEAHRDERRRAAINAQFIVTLAFDAEGYQKLLSDL